MWEKMKDSFSQLLHSYWKITFMNDYCIDLVPRWAWEHPETLTHLFVKPPTPYTQLWIHLCLCRAVSLTLPWRCCVLSRCYLLSAEGPTWNLRLPLFFLYWHLDLDIFIEIHLAIYRRESISSLCSVSLIYMAVFLSFLFLFFFFFFCWSSQLARLQFPNPGSNQGPSHVSTEPWPLNY